MNRTRFWLLALFVSAFLFGATDVWFAHVRGTAKDLVFWLPLILSVLLLFGWLRADSDAQSYPRSTALTAGIVGLAIVFVPIYLYKSRAPGSRVKAIAGFVLFFAAYLALSYAGAQFAGHVSL